MKKPSAKAFLSYLKPMRTDKVVEPTSATDGDRNADAHATTAGQDALLEAQDPTTAEHTTPATTTASNADTTIVRSPSHPSLARAPSRPASLFPANAEREPHDLGEIKCDVMSNWLYQQQMERLWTTGGRDEGVVLKKSRVAYCCAPADLSESPDGFFRAVEALNVRVAMTVNTRVIKLLLLLVAGGGDGGGRRDFVPLRKGLRLQVLPTMTALARCQKHQFAAFVRDRGVLVVWDDEPRHVLDRALKIEKALMEMVWESVERDEDEMERESGGRKTPASTAVSQVDGDRKAEEEDEGGLGEKGNVEETRKVLMLMPCISAATLALTTLTVVSGYRHVAKGIRLDHGWWRLGYLLALPAQIWLALFFFQAMVGNLAHIFGPVSQLRRNTKFYSGVRPKRLHRGSGPLPHVTIQMPVYKEGLKTVIEPTVTSIKAAISTYEMQGGTANVFINDDGMQLISDEDAQARQDFYDEHNIGWVARPKHNPKPKEGEELFLRRGKFKKASNMNYALWISVRIEDKLNELNRSEKWCQEDEAFAYKQSLAEVVEEDEGRTWADGNVRIGDYILIIDSDTRVPSDCFLDCVSEMEQSLQVAVIQYVSGVMNVTDSFFERGITFFTNLVYTSIRYSVATGDVAPFVGHNAVLRWSAMQEISYECENDHREKYWSEATVSEDFDMALRLQTAGYLVRFGGYTGEGFQEGVSLTVYDELSRWEKYAYGCSELIFHPFRYWLIRGPFTKLFIRFIFSGMPMCSKVTICAYIGTYYALASAWILTLANYFITGLFEGYYDHFYIDSFKVYFAIIVVFTGLGNIALAILRYRTAEKNFLRALGENISWVPLLVIFLGGISLHVSQAILSHLLNVDMTWGATSKEAENTTFFREIPKIVTRFKGTFLFCAICTAMMVVMARVVPPIYRIDLFVAIYPLSAVLIGHGLLPIALNPGLMRFTF